MGLIFPNYLSKHIFQYLVFTTQPKYSCLSFTKKDCYFCFCSCHFPVWQAFSLLLVVEFYSSFKTGLFVPVSVFLHGWVCPIQRRFMFPVLKGTWHLPALNDCCINIWVNTRPSQIPLRSHFPPNSWRTPLASYLTWFISFVSVSFLSHSLLLNLLCGDRDHIFRVVLCSTQITADFKMIDSRFTE